MNHHYTAVVAREDGYWLADVPEVAGAHAYARTLSRLRAELADAIVLAADLPDEGKVLIDFTVDASVPGADVLARAFELAHQRHEVATAEARVHEQLVKTVQEMTGRYSVRDVAGALDITPGRVSQLTGATK